MLALIAKTIETVTPINQMTGHKIRGDLIDLLQSQSKELEELSGSFRNRLLGLEIVTFYEQNTMRGFKELVRPFIFVDLALFVGIHH